MWGIFVAGIIPVIFIIIFIIGLVKASKDVQKEIKETKEEGKTPFTDLANSLKKFTTNLNTVKCKYCGTIVKRGETNCPNCSAAISIEE